MAARPPHEMQDRCPGYSAAADVAREARLDWLAGLYITAFDSHDLSAMRRIRDMAAGDPEALAIMDDIVDGAIDDPGCRARG